MPDIDIDPSPRVDPLDRAFATFVSEAPREIIAPGSAAVRRTVTRRRATKTVATMIVTLGIVGGGVFTLPSMVGHGDGMMSPGAANDEGVLLGYRDQALAAILGAGTTPDNAPDVIFGADAPVTGAHGGAISTFGQSDTPYVSAGSFLFTFVCVGSGKIAVKWSGATTGSTTVACSPASIEAFVPITTTTGGDIAVTITADSDAIGRSGLAYVLGPPPLEPATLSSLETEAVSLVNAIDRSSSYGYFTPAAPGLSRKLTGATGTYPIEFACVGAGDMRVHLGIGSHAADAVITCNQPATPLTIDAGDGGALTVTATPNFSALGHAGWAFAVPNG